MSTPQSTVPYDSDLLPIERPAREAISLYAWRLVVLLGVAATSVVAIWFILTVFFHPVSSGNLFLEFPLAIRLFSHSIWLDIAICVLTVLSVYHGALWLVAPLLAPIEANTASRTAMRRLLRRFANGSKIAMVVIRNGDALPGPDGLSRTNAYGQGIVLVDSSSAVLTSTKEGYSRFLDPGVHFLREDEFLRNIVDFRPQVRSREVRAQTRDGIWIRFKVSTTFQLDGSNSLGEIRYGGLPYSYSARRILQAVQLERHSPEEVIKWDEIAINEAVKRVQVLIAGYTFDQLTEPRDPRIDRRPEIRDTLKGEVESALSGSGIRLRGIRISQFVPVSPNVIHQRLQDWKANWSGRISIIEAEGETERTRRMGLSEAQAQMELLLRTVEALEDTKSIETMDSEQVMLAILEIVRQFSVRSAMHQSSPQKVREALSQTYRRLLSQE